MNHKIDIVIPWVDGADEAWLREKNNWQKKLNPDQKSNSNARYQSWDNLQYWFRAIEKNLSWANRIFLVTWGHVPEFLDLSNDRLVVIKHEDYIPHKYLPTFNANTIELNFHKISELSEKFIYFNDDMFPLQSVGEDYYFKDDLVCDEAIETPIIPILNGDIAQFTWNMRALDTAVINRNFNKRDVQSGHFDNWFNDCYGELLERNKSLSYWDNFVGFRDPHLPQAFKKSTFKKVWDAEYEVLDKACLAKFRNFDCVNQWLIRYWQLCEGNFNPRRTLGKSFVVNIENCNDIANIIRNKEQQTICLNEDCDESDFEVIKRTINTALEEVFPDKSQFEK